MTTPELVVAVGVLVGLLAGAFFAGRFWELHSWMKSNEAADTYDEWDEFQANVEAWAETNDDGRA